jgi:hypothetical protein
VSEVANSDIAAMAISTGFLEKLPFGKCFMY